MHARTKMNKMLQAKRLYFLTPGGLTDIELAKALQVGRATAYRYRVELGAFEVAENRYTLRPTQEDILLALAVLQRALRRA